MVAATLPRPLYESSFWASKEEHETSHNASEPRSANLLSQQAGRRHSRLLQTNAIRGAGEFSMQLYERP